MQFPVAFAVLSYNRDTQVFGWRRICLGFIIVVTHHQSKLIGLATWSFSLSSHFPVHYTDAGTKYLSIHKWFSYTLYSSKTVVLPSVTGDGL